MDNAEFPPPCMHPDDYAAADPARQRLAQKRSFSLLAPLHKLKKRAPALPSTTFSLMRGKGKIFGKDSAQNNSSPVHDESDESRSVSEPIICISGDTINEDEDQDEYRWAILYENQRGATVFSTAYYSSLSLLPSDPPAFTVPSAYGDRSKQPNVSITSFPLPDGTWRWVSKAWMIDMRTDSGEVQHDGFEYNWKFRKGKWRSEVGALSAGGLVRRRRWVRLMMRPAKPKHARPEMDQPSSAVDGSPWDHDHPTWIESILEGRTGSISSAQSVTTRASETLDESLDTSVDDVWQGRDSEQDWARCHALMKRLGRDGRRLEIWKKWLQTYLTEPELLMMGKGKGKQALNQWSEDSTRQSSEGLSVISSPCPEAPPPLLEHIASVVHVHGDCILRLFIFPDSRAQFIKLLDHAGLLPELKTKFGIGLSTSEVDFWSYMNTLDAVPEVDHEGDKHDQEEME